jgi:replicative DNA helicase
MSDTNPNNVRTPPFDETVERALIGSVFLDQSVLNRIADVVTAPQAFYRESHRHVWRALTALERQNTSVDLVTVMDWLDARELLEKAGGQSVLLRLTESVPSAANALHYARIVARHWRARRAIESFDWAVEELYQGTPADDVLEKVAPNVDALLNAYTGPEPGSPEVLADQLFHADDALTLPTKIEPFDAVLDGGVRIGEGYVIGARTGVGKTTTTAALVGALMEAHNPIVHWWSTEISAKLTAHKILASVKNIYESWLRDPSRIENESMRRQTVRRLPMLRKWWREHDCTIFASGRPHVEAVARKAKAARSKHPDRPLVIVADYVQRFDAGEYSLKENVSQASQRLQGLALELDAVSFVLTQLTEADKNKARSHPYNFPHPEQAKQSSSIADDASNFLLFDRPYKGDEEYDQLGVMENAKARYGSERHVWVKGSGAGAFTWWSGYPPESMPDMRTPRIDGYDLGEV